MHHLFEINYKRNVMKKIVLTTASLFFLATNLVANDYYATVNGDKITKQDINLLIQDPRVDFNQLPDEMKKQIIDGAINRKLLAKNALDSGVEKDAEYIDAMNRIKEDVALQVWQKQKVDSIKFSEKEKKEFYNKNKEKFIIPENFEARHILVDSEKDAKDVVKELDKAVNKEAKFKELAKAKSKDGAGQNEGYLGKFSANDMVPDFSNAIKALKKGTYSKTPVKTEFGYHVIFLIDKTPSNELSYDEVKDNIERIMKSEKLNKDIEQLVSDLRKKAKIVIK